MSVPDPFSRRFEVFGRDPKDLVRSINRPARDLLKAYLRAGSEGSGRVILLQAPRAGYGKTSLLQSVASDLGDSYHFVRIQLTNGRTTDAAHVLEYVLQALCEVVPESGTLTQLDLLARRVLALGLEPLVASGEVPCQDRESALESLRDNPAQTFDFHYDGAVTAHWTKSNFEVLGPRLAAELARISGASLREASYWVELLFRFATTPPDNVERARLLFETIFRNDLQNQSSSTAEERLHGLLSLISTVACPVLVVDDTEGLSTSPQDALALASFLSNISQTCPGAVAILSVNDDIWASSFAPHLPGGLADRLLAYKITLDALNAEEVEAIITERAGERAPEILGKINWGESGDTLYPRRVVERASDAWAQLDHQGAGETGVEAVKPPQTNPSGDALEDLPDFGHNKVISGSARDLQSERFSPSDSYPEEDQVREVPILNPQLSGLQSFESPFIPAPEDSPFAAREAKPDPSEVPEAPLAETSPLEPVGSESEQPAPTFPSPFEQVPEADTSDNLESPSGYPPAGLSTVEQVEHSAPQEVQRARPFRPRSAESNFQVAQPESSEAAQADKSPYRDHRPQTPETVARSQEESAPFNGIANPGDNASDLDRQDPTRGEIEFSKLKPLLEAPSSNNFGGHEASDPREPKRESFGNEEGIAPTPGLNNSESEKGLQEGAESESRAQVVPMVSPFEPHAVDSAESPFADRGPASPQRSGTPEGAEEPPQEVDSMGDFSRDSQPREGGVETTFNQMTGPGNDAPNQPSVQDDPGKEWWPGDPSTTIEDTTSAAPSPFVAVGKPPESMKYPNIPQERAVAQSSDPAAADREEVERMLRLLRERQDNH